MPSIKVKSAIQKEIIEKYYSKLEFKIPKVNDVELKQESDPNKEMIDRDQFISVSSFKELNGKSERSANHWSATVAPMSHMLGVKILNDSGDD